MNGEGLPKGRGSSGGDAGVLLYVGVNQIAPSPFNPRSELGDLEGLKTSIKTNGILQALLVRPGSVKGEYELVCGHRRLAASKALGIGLVPVAVRALDDKQVIESQVSENAERLDVHPLDEAGAIKRLVKDHKVEPKEVAVRLGRTPTHVYQRLKLAELGPEASKLFRGGKLTVRTALFVARIPNADLQAKAAREIAGGGMGEAEAAAHVQRGYMLNLKLAPFDTAHETLYGSAGSCDKCPKRTGNQRELFGDVKQGDLCTDPKCFKSKADAAWKGIETKAAALDWKILPKDESRAVLAGRQDGELATTRFVDLDVKCKEDPKGRTWRQLVGKGEVTIYVARDFDVGTVYYLARRKEACEAGVVNGHAFLKVDTSKDDPKLSLRRRTLPRIYREIAQRKGAGLDDVLSTITDALVERGQADQIAQLLMDAGVEHAEKDRGRPGAWLKRIIDDIDGEIDEYGLLLLCVLGKAGIQVTTGYDRHLIAIADLLDVDVKALEQAVKKEGAAPAGGGEKMAKSRKAAKAKG